MLLDGLVADVQHLGNLLVRQPLGHLPQHFPLALGQRGFHVGGALAILGGTSCTASRSPERHIAAART